MPRGLRAGRGPSRSASPSRNSRRVRLHRALRELRAELSAAWGEGVVGQSCAVTGRRAGDEDRPKIDGHHVCEAAWIRDAARRRGYTPEQTIRALWDPRNRLPVEHLTHLAHHAWARQGTARIPRAVVLRHCPHVLAFADEHGLRDRFDAAYPAETTTERN